MIDEKDFDTIINDIIWSYEECGMKVPQNILDTLNILKQFQGILNEYNVSAENIRRVLLTGQMFINQPTFEQCIKEWEDRDYIIEQGITHMWISTVDGNIVATFDLCDNCVTTSLFIDYELSLLINKTLKSLEEMKDDNI